MKQILLLTVASALCFPALAADQLEPKMLENTLVYSLSPDGQYVVSDGYSGMKIFDLNSNKVYEYTTESGNGRYAPGISQCVSNNGVVLGYFDDTEASYWIDGEWNLIEIPAYATSSNTVHAITPDGQRICGSIGVASISSGNEDVLMQAPCIWDWDPSSGEFGAPVMLPHPDVDFTGRIPQMITALTISHDGKTIIGQIVNATGMLAYPILYRENEEGEWSYEIPDDEALHPEGIVFPEYPGDQGPVYPTEESFMTPAEIQAYTDALQEYYNSGYTLPYPLYKDYMTEEEIKAFDEAMNEFLVLNEEWQSKFNAWMDTFYEMKKLIPDYQFNSIRISPDGKKYACTVEVIGERNPSSWFVVPDKFIWVFDIESGNVTKYEQQKDFVLTYLGNDGVALAYINKNVAPQSFVLKDGEAIEMYDWISGHQPVYKSWMDENLVFEVQQQVWNEELEDYVLSYTEVLLTGRAYATPDLSEIVLGVENVWDYSDDGISYVFDMGNTSGVSQIATENSVNAIYDLSGRKLKSASAPGIYIINGEKKVVR
ncbi:MAG: hypothetical protein K2N35_17285 [Muribaculaceae bacterium]|nr:hypothetical protein [Muribaculaceae bacterium]